MTVGGMGFIPERLLMMMFGVSNNNNNNRRLGVSGLLVFVPYCIIE